MKTLAIIIGRAPQKYNKDMNQDEIVTWHVDLEINSAIKISRQQAFIAFNFLTQKFEIKNLSDEHKIYINGKAIGGYDDPVALESSNVIQIGSEDFIFLLPLDSNLPKKTKPKQKDQNVTKIKHESEIVKNEVDLQSDNKSPLVMLSNSA